MGYRKLNFVLAVFGVIVATAGLIAQTVFLRAYDLRSESFLAGDMEAAVQRLKAMENEYRKKTLQYGFNVRVLPEGQSLADFYEEGYASKTMDQNYARRLADSEILTTIRHLAPILRQKVTWEERKRKIVLIGTHGEEPLKERKRRKKSIIKTIPDGKIDVGYDLCKSFDLKPDQEITLMGRKFTIRKCLTERGSQDDISVWVDLQAVQEMTDMVGKINEIQAVDCKCADASPVKIRNELSKILPGAQVTVKAKPAVARAAIRVIAEQGRVKELKARKAGWTQHRRGRRDLTLVTAPIIITGAAVWILLLAFSNVRQRTMEIGILRAIGLGGGQILSIFLIRSLLIGLVGGALGLAAGLTLSANVNWIEDVIYRWTGWKAFPPEIYYLDKLPHVEDPVAFGTMALVAVVVSLVAAVWPAIKASRLNPIEALRYE